MTNLPATATSRGGGPERREPIKRNAFYRWLRAYAGRVTKVARLLGVTPSCVYDLRSRRRYPSDELARKINRLTRGAVPPTSWR